MTNILTSTVDISAGSPPVIKWNGAPLWAANCPADSQIMIDGIGYFVASLTDTSHVVLTRDYAGTVPATGIPAEINPITAQTADVGQLNISTATIIRLLSQLSGTGLKVDGIGLFSDLSAHDAETTGYVYLSLDGDGDTIDTAVLFIKNSATSGDWSDAVPVTGPEGPAGGPGLIGDWRGAWVTGMAYAVDDAVQQGGSGYICLVAHTAGTFATDLAAGKWELAVAKGDQGDPGAIGGSTGSTDNRLLRADGIGGATVQASAVTVDDSGNMSGVGTLGAGAITTTGLLTVNGQIKFPATQAASTDANTLDDYEEGTYTPTWTAPSSNPAIGNGTLSGAYTKVGRLVSAEIKMLAGSTTTFGGGAWTIGLPFTASALNGSGAVHGFDSGTANRAGCCVAVSTTGLQLESDGAGGSWGPATPQGWAVNDYFNLTYTYPAS